MWLLALFASIISGVFIVYSRMMNAHLGEHIGIFRANVVNHVVGSVVAFVLVIVFLGMEPVRNTSVYSGPWWLYVGGAIGAVMVSISNYVVPEIPIVAATTLIFVGQGAAGIVLDAMRNGLFSWTDMVGLALIMVGFWELQRKRDGANTPIPVPLPVPSSSKK
jgi:transporter family-2 protein